MAAFKVDVSKYAVGTLLGVDYRVVECSRCGDGCVSLGHGFTRVHTFFVGTDRVVVNRHCDNGRADCWCSLSCKHTYNESTLKYDELKHGVDFDAVCRVDDDDEEAA